MVQFWMLDEIQKVCSTAQFPEPLPQYTSLYNIAVAKGGWAMVCPWYL